MRDRRPNLLARLALGAGAAGVAALLLAATALGGTIVAVGSVNQGSANGLNYRSATFSNAPSPSIVEAAAKCPSTRTLTGGGALTTRQSDTAWLTRDSPNDSLPFSTTRTWLAGLFNNTGLQQDLTAYAVCARHAGLKFVTQTKDGVAGGSVGTVKARCPAGTSVTGGGDSNTSNEDQILTTAPFDSGDKGTKPDDGWKVRDRPVSGSADISAHAICTSKLKLGYKKASRTLSGSGDGVGASCPKDASVTGGGASITGGPEAFINSSNPVDRSSDADSTPDDAWNTFASLVSGGDRTLTTFAICKL